MWKQATRMTDVGIEGVREELKMPDIPKFVLPICFTVKTQVIK